jgi:Galactose oxidase, central domain/Kelch motif
MPRRFAWLGLASALPLTASTAAANGAFVPIADMSFARYAAAAATVADGSTLVFGPTYDSDRFDPDAQAFAEAGTIPGPRFLAKLLPLAGGDALLIGGSSTDARTVRYDAERKLWSWSIPMTMARTQAQVAMLVDGRVLIAGGYGANGVALASAELYDPVTNAFSATASMPRARQGGIAEILSDGRVLLAGGVGASGYGDPCAQVYAPATGSFADAGCFYAAQQGLYKPASARLGDGRVLVSGGVAITGSTTQRVSDDAEVYDPATDSWMPHLVAARAEHSLTTLPDGRVLVAGGRGYFGQPLAATEIFNPATDTFQPGPSLVQARFGHTATMLAGNRVLIAGGQVGVGQWTATAEVYQGDAMFAGGFEAPNP